MKPIHYLTYAWLFFIVITSSFSAAQAQLKKPLTHDVYDSWKSVGKKAISDNGNYIFYQIESQEGDGDLFIAKSNATQILQQIPRGYQAAFINNDFVLGKIKPLFKDTRAAKIKNKKAEDLPKDSLFIFQLKQKSLEKIPTIRSFKTPKYNNGWVAYMLDTNTFKTAIGDKNKDARLVKMVDSIIKKSIKKIKGKITKEKLTKIAEEAARKIHKNAYDDIFAEGNEESNDNKKSPKGYDLVVKNLATNQQKLFQLVADYEFDKNGNTLLLKQSKYDKDSATQNRILLYHLSQNKIDTLKRGFNDAKNFTASEDGVQWAFMAEVDSSVKALQKFYKLYCFRSGQDSANMIADRFSNAFDKGQTFNDLSDVVFSKDGSKLFFGVSPIRIPKDTTRVEFETAKLDIWHYNDDELQPQQLKNVRKQLAKSNLVVYHTANNQLLQLTHTSEDIETSIVDEGNATWILAQTTKGNRVLANWEGRSKKTAYVIDVNSGAKTLIQKGIFANFSASPNGNYILWYDIKQKAYFSYQVATKKTQKISSAVSQAVFDIENDVPDYPSAVGIAGWTQDDESVWIETEKDIWEVPLQHPEAAKNITEQNEPNVRWGYNFVKTNLEQRFFTPQDTLLFVAQNKTTKEWRLYTYQMQTRTGKLLDAEPMAIFGVEKAKNAEMYLLQKSNVQMSELYVGADFKQLTKITDVAAQQKDFNWLTVELVRWKMFDGNMSEGILYKPENFDPNKKYPIIFYFYERNTDGLYNYKTPVPSASIINIPYFVSNGYLVFDPNIYYRIGDPGESAYNSVVSAAEFLSKKPWVDAANMAIQGQSWGGYQVAYLVTRTSMFKAAGAGAPVSNMTSAYGGIRWGSGLVREFQYEKGQSRIGVSLWDRQDLYLKNSPLFHLPKVTTPLLIMHNDQDGAVPWYQGIEMFTGLRRLGKKAWMLQYNGEDHNLKERRNKKDLSIRLSQFFDYYLRRAAPAKWITEGVPAINKNLDWGLEVETK